MEDYSKKSDFEINNEIASVLCKEMNDGSEYSVFMCESLVRNVPNYCNNPSDMWPLIVENNIALRPIYIREYNNKKTIEWEAKNTQRDFPNKTVGWDDKNPLRAAAIVFLMLNDKD